MDFLDNIFLDNTLRSYLIVGSIILFVLLLRRVVSHYVATLLYIFIHKKWHNIEKPAFKRKVIRPLGWFIVIVVSVLTLNTLNYPAAWHFSVYGNNVDILIERLGVCLMIIFFIKLLLGIVDFIGLVLQQKTMATIQQSDDQLVVFYRDLLKVLIGLAGILFLIKVGFNQNIGTLLTGLSIVGAAVALAAKESLENLIASFIIFFDKPFYVGDLLKVNNVTGTVERIGLRSTRIRTPEKTLVTVPNKQMVDSIVDNYSMRSERRAELKFEFSTKTDSEAITSFISKTKARLDKDKNDIVKHSVFFTEMSKSGITITIEYFTVPFTMGEYNKLKQSIMLFMRDTIDEMKLEAPAASTDIHIMQGSGPVPPPTKTII